MWIFESQDGTKYYFIHGTHLVGRESHYLNIMHASISRRHSEIYVSLQADVNDKKMLSRSTISIKDLKSTGGTFLNGQKLAAEVVQELKEGDKVHFGPHTLTPTLELKWLPIVVCDTQLNSAIEKTDLKRYISIIGKTPKDFFQYIVYI